MPETGPLLFTDTTVTFGTSSYSCEILGLAGEGRSRVVHQTTHSATSGSSHTKLVGDFKDEGAVRVRVNYNPDNPPPYSDAETVTITFRVPSGLTNGTTFSGSAAITEDDWEGEVEGLMGGSFVITWLGAVTVGAAS